MPDRKITQFPDFEGTADSSLFFVVASGDSNDLLSKNYRFPFTQLASDVVGASSPWKLGSDSIYTLTGLVGMGTASPAYQLDVAGTISGYSGKFKEGIFSEGLTISGQPVATGEGGKWSDGASAGVIYYDGGNVGIGVGVDPVAPLTVKGSANDYLLLLETDVAGGNHHRALIRGSDTTSAYLDLWDADTINTVRLTTSGNSYLAGGDVVIGDTNALARLHVTGGDGRILAPSGNFTESLNLSGTLVALQSGLLIDGGYF